MRRGYRGLLCGLLALLLAWPGAGRAYADDKIVLQLTYDGKTMVYENRAVTLSVNEEVLTGLSMPPVILDNRVYVPAREVFERLGAVVDWKAEAEEAYIGYRDTLLIAAIGKPSLLVNGRTVPIDAPPRKINGKTMLPVSAVAQALDFFVHWDAKTYTVTILAPPDTSSPVSPAPQPESPPEQPAETPPPGEYVIPEEPEPVPTPQAYVPDNPNVETAVAIANFARDVSQSALTVEERPLARVTGFAAAGDNQYTVTADAPISRVDKILLKDNRLILDIYNAEMALPKQTYDFNLAYLKSVRAAQNMTTPQMVTRLVFDITEAVSFSVKLSADRKSVTVRFEQNAVVDCSFYKEGAADKIIIEGITAPLVSLSILANPDRLVVDLPLANMLTAAKEAVPGNFVSSFAAGKRDETTGRVTVELKQSAQYAVSKIGSQTIITVTAQTLKSGVKADGAAFTLKKPQGKNLTAAAIAQYDDYLRLKYVFTLPGDFTADYGNGQYVINQNGVATVALATANGKTTLTVNETKVMAYRVTEDAENIYIHAVNPKERYDRIVVIDPGHGGTDPGGESNGVQEKGFNLDIALRLIKLLEADGSVKVYSTRLDDTYPTRAERAIFGNELGDIFVSIHNNKFNGVATGTETLWMPHANEKALGFACEQMANIFQKAVLAELGSKNRRVAYQDIQVLRESTIPACLVEISFIDSQPDLANLQTEAYRQKAAAGLMKGILDTFRAYKPAR